MAAVRLCGACWGRGDRIGEGGRRVTAEAFCRRTVDRIVLTFRPPSLIVCRFMLIRLTIDLRYVYVRSAQLRLLILNDKYNLFVGVASNDNKPAIFAIV